MSDSKKSKAKSPAGKGKAQAEPKAKRSRCMKDRPATVEQLALAIRENRLDNRTRAAQDMISLRDAIAKAPQEAAKGLVQDVLAANVTIMTAVLRELTSPGVKLIGDDGQVHNLIARTWPELQRATISAARTLADMEAKGNPAPAPGKPEGTAVDLSALVLAAAQEVDE